MASTALIEALQDLRRRDLLPRFVVDEVWLISAFSSWCLIRGVTHAFLKDWPHDPTAWFTVNLATLNIITITGMLSYLPESLA